MKLGIQCKRFTKPCGNRAVQEAIAGGAFYQIPNVAVLSPSGFTNSAVALAQKTNCILLSNFDLPKLDDLLDINTPHISSDTHLSDEIDLELLSDAERILGRCFTLVAKKTLTENESLRSILPDLAYKVSKGIDANSGAGKLSLSKVELKALLDFSIVWLTSNVKLSTTKSAPKMLPGDVGCENVKGEAKVSLDARAAGKLDHDSLIAFYLIFPREDIKELQRIIGALYYKHKLPAPLTFTDFLQISI